MEGTFIWNIMICKYKPYMIRDIWKIVLVNSRYYFFIRTHFHKNYSLWQYFRNFEISTGNVMYLQYVFFQGLDFNTEIGSNFRLYISCPKPEIDWCLWIFEIWNLPLPEEVCPFFCLISGWYCQNSSYRIPAILVS